MQLVSLWGRGLALLVIMSGAAYADASPGPQGQTAASVDSRLSKLLGQEKVSFREVSAQRIAAITTPPSKDYGDAVDAVRYTDSFLDRLPEASGGKQWNCLATAIYFESRGESVKGEFAVAEVIANRVDSENFPDSYCKVVNQGSSQRNACQFSYACDGLPDTIRERDAFEKAGKIARLIIDGAPRVLTDGATYFHTVHVNPSWSRRFEETASIGAHIFYRNPKDAIEPVQVASN